MLHAQKPREIAAHVLRQRQAGGDFTENLLEAALDRAKLPAADRSLCREIVCGVVRWQATLDWLIARRTGGRRQKAGLQDLLRLGLYQIFWLDRIPDHAAVHETVELAKQGGFGAQAGFVNALLRGYLRETDATRRLLAELKATQPALGCSHPDWLVGRWQKRWGAARTGQLLEWNNTPPKTYARVNTLKSRTDFDPTVSALIEKWRAEGVDYDFKTWDWTGANLMFLLKSHPPLTSLPSFREGGFYVQDPSTLLAVRELDPQAGDTVLDLCAAPGGKTTFIAQLMRNQGRIVAQDISADRLKLVQQNCGRLGVTCVEAVIGRLARPHPGPPPPDEGETSAPARQAGDRGNAPKINTAVPPPGTESRGGREPVPPSPVLLPAARFDKALVDAPCSNTGVMRRRVDLRWRISPEEIGRARMAQLALLHQAAAGVRPGGVLVYSTCSLEPEENGEVVQEFLSGHADFKLDRERELLPFADGVDGAYVARMRKGPVI